MKYGMGRDRFIVTTLITPEMKPGFTFTTFITTALAALVACLPL